jgi:oligopeptide transport system substrate-binding protein
VISVANLVIFGCVLLVLGGCRGKEASSRSPGIRIALSVELSSLDPQITSSIDAVKVQSVLFETLVKQDAGSGELEPWGASSWEISNEGKTYRFHLREDSSWSDGSPVGAHDYVFAFHRLFEPTLAAPFASMYAMIAGAKGYSSELGNRDHSGLGVVAVDERTLEIHLEQAVPYFLHLLARPCVAALPSRWMEQHHDHRSRKSSWSLTPGFPSSGPYMLESWTVNQWIRLRPNPHYRTVRGENAKNLVFFPMENAYTQETAFRAGLLEVTSKIASERIARYLGSDLLSVQDEFGTAYLIVNQDSPAMENPDLRRALSSAVDRDALTKHVRKRGESPAWRFCPPVGDYRHCGVAVMPVASKAEKKWEGTGPLKLLIVSSEMNQKIAEALQSMWMERLGISVIILRQEWKSYLTSRNQGEFDLCLGTWIGDYPDPLAFLEMWESDNPNNFARWRDPVYREILQEASRCYDSQQRISELKKAENRMLESGVVIPLYHLNRVFLVSSQLDGWPQTLSNTIDYAEVRWR